MDVTLQVKKNGGAPATGGIAANVGDSIQLTALNKAQWPGNQVRWELKEYGLGFALPAGWTQDTDDATMPTYFCLGVSDPPAFTVDRAGPFAPRVIVASVVDERTAVRVDYTSGIHPIARGEGSQFGGPKMQFAIVAEQNSKTIDGALAGSGAATDYAPTGLTGATGITRYAGGTASGAPTSGPFLVGDWIEDRTGGFWCCISAGTPGSWLYVPVIQPINKITTAGQTLKASPAGTINELSGSGTGAVLPAATTATAGWIAVVKFANLATYAIGRTGSDTIDGATSFTPSSGPANYQSASWYVSASGVWLSL